MTSSAASRSAMLHCDDVLCNCYAYCVCMSVQSVFNRLCVVCFAGCDYDVWVCQCVCVSDCMCVCMWICVCVCLLRLFDCLCTWCNVVIDWLKPTVCCCSPPSYTTMDPTLGNVSQQLEELTDGFMNKADPVLQGWDATLCVDSLFGLSLPLQCYDLSMSSLFAQAINWKTRSSGTGGWPPCPSKEGALHDFANEAGFAA